MTKTVYSEPGIEALEDGQILLMRCPRCKRENYALEVISGYCVWCGYDTHKDEDLKRRIHNKRILKETGLEGKWNLDNKETS